MESLPNSRILDTKKRRRNVLDSDNNECESRTPRKRVRHSPLPQNSIEGFQESQLTRPITQTSIDSSTIFGDSNSHTQTKKIPRSTINLANDSLSLNIEDDSSQSSNTTRAEEPESEAENSSTSSSSSPAESNLDFEDIASEDTSSIGNSSADSDDESTHSSESSSNSDAQSNSDAISSKKSRTTHAHAHPPIQRPFHANQKSIPTPGRNLAQLKSRLEALLPQIHAANQELEIAEREGRLDERDIEQLGDGDGTHIEMDLALGVLEEKEEKEWKIKGLGVKKEEDDDGNDDDANESAGEEKLLSLLLDGVERGKRKKVGIEVVAEEA